MLQTLAVSRSKEHTGESLPHQMMRRLDVDLLVYFLVSPRTRC